MRVTGTHEREHARHQLIRELIAGQKPQTSISATLGDLLQQLDTAGERLSPDVTAAFAQCSERKALWSALVERVDDAIARSLVETFGKPAGHWPAFHAVSLLAANFGGRALPSMLSWLCCKPPDWLARRLINTLRRHGADVVEPAFNVYYFAEDTDQRAMVLEVLSACRATDVRILIACQSWLASEPAFAADMLRDYGDPAAIEPLRSRLATLLPSEHVAALAIVDALEALGHKLDLIEITLRDTASRGLATALVELEEALD